METKKRRLRTVRIDGEDRPVSKVAREHGISRATLHYRLRMGWTVERAATEPVHPQRCAVVTIDGVERPAVDVARERGISRQVLYHRLHTGWTAERAVTEPTGSTWKKRGPQPIDRTGQRFGAWTVTGPQTVERNGRVPARCDCGTERLVRPSALLDGTSRGCAVACSRAAAEPESTIPVVAQPLGRALDRTGLRFGRLTVRRYLGRELLTPHMTVWRCACDCGGTADARANHLITGDVTSCGCASSDAAAARRVSIVGERFDQLVVLAEDAPPGEGVTLRCDCGFRVATTRTNLLARLLRGKDHPRERAASCPACDRSGTIDLTGQRFGRLTVLRRAGSDAPKGGQAVWLCACDCGRQHTVRGAHLRRGAVRSCGQCPQAA